MNYKPTSSVKLLIVTLLLALLLAAGITVRTGRVQAAQSNPTIAEILSGDSNFTNPGSNFRCIFAHANV